MSDLPVEWNSSGPQVQTAAALREKIVSIATQLAPGITTELPGSLIEDIASTSAGALLICDQARVDAINSVSPLTANLFVLNLLAQQYGVQGQKIAGFTAVDVTFTGPAAFIIPEGFQVSDGSNTFALPYAIVINADGESDPVTCIATVSGAFAVPEGTVTRIVTGVPAGITLSCTNKTPGIPGSGAETVAQYRARVWDAGIPTVQGYPGFIRTALANVANINLRLTAVIADGDRWVIMCGGGNTYAMAAAIYQSAGDISRLKGCALEVTGITSASPGVVTTNITHGFSDGQTVTLKGVEGMTGINGTPFKISVLSPHSFSLNSDTSGAGTWAGGGEVTPNLRNQRVTVTDWPDTYLIPFVIPLQQNVKIFFKWRTDGVNYLTAQSVNSVVSAPVIAYINQLYAGKPLNLNTVKDIFLSAISSILNPDLISALDVTVTVNGVITAPQAAMDIITGDPYSYWYIAANGVTVSEG
ncbi:Baseplate J-like protein [Izhakiella capsodis]|uniref:Baseplate J-like protein n=1 Tax=Izhakiella capsodis TaxID=1367852 RepID=A0A1I5BCE4_9GAMM|nr:ubiquitin-activating E1 FCCH domain-containing protein [Izhakiella capsodis]SFN72382.1 Baseplate J-like protein [Izhakiella capsodis]